MIGFKLKLHLIFLHLLVKYGYSLVELTCDFTTGEGSLSDANISMCVRKLNDDTKLDIICPNKVEGEIDYNFLSRELSQLERMDRENSYYELIARLMNEGFRKPDEDDDGEYSIFPRNYSEEVKILGVNELTSRVSADKYSVWEIFGTKNENPISKVNLKNRQVLTIKPPADNALTIKKHKVMIYTCIKEKYLDDVDGKFYELMLNRSYFTTPNEYTKLRVPILGNGNPNIRVGIAIVVLNRIPLVETGCGNVETKFFTNVPDYDPVENFPKCEVDVMMNPNVGFYCEGNIQPEHCLETFIDFNNPERVFSIEREAIIEDGRVGNHLIFTNYKLKELPAPFKGYCNCLDSKNRVIARIIVERKTEHECNITNLLMKNKVRKIKDDWCSLTMHPGDSLKITFPPNTDNIQYKNFLTRTRTRHYEYDQEEDEKPPIHPTVDDFNEKPNIYELTYMNKTLEEIMEKQDGKESQDEGASQSEDSKEEKKVDHGVPKSGETKDEMEDVAKEEESQDQESKSGSVEDLILSERSRRPPIIPIGDLEEIETPNYPFLTFLSPKKITKKLNLYSLMTDSMNSVNMREVLSGDAYHVDDSQILNGVITIHYRRKPLGKKSAIHTLAYYWALKQRKQKHLEILAKVSIKLAQLHNYSYGCETKESGVFIPNVESEHIKYGFNGSKMRKVRNFMYEASSHHSYGISCGEDETLYPNNVGIIMVDNKTDLRYRADLNIKSIAYPNLPNFRQFRKRGDVNIIYSYRCGCIDSEGVEKTRLVLYTARPAFNACIFSVEDYKKIALIPYVKMFLPYFEEEGTKIRSDMTNSLPEPELIPIPEEFPRQFISLTQGSKTKISAVDPIMMSHAIRVELEGQDPKTYPPNYTLIGVRHENEVNKYEPYTDPSLSPKRIFPVNATRYFYKVIEGNPRYLQPVEYSSVMSTNVTGFTMTVRRVVNSMILDNQSLYMVLPRGAIVIIKDENAKYLELTYASGAISSPEEAKSDKSEVEESKQEEEEPSPSGGRRRSSWKTLKSFGRKSVSKIRRAGRGGRRQRRSRWIKTRQKDQKQEEKDQDKKDGNDKDEDELKDLHVKKEKRHESYDEEDNKEEKRIINDVRKMEIWRIHTVLLEATNPWVRGCGANQEGEDFFKPETEKIVENGEEKGCKVKIKPGEVVGFYCPEPYVLYPVGCFDHFYDETNRKVDFLNTDIFEKVEHENKSFKYIKLKKNLKVKVKSLFEKGKKMVCYCRTIKGKEMSKIEISL